MRYFNQLIILSCLSLSSSAYAAYEVFVDPLYWRATETLDWMHSNNLNPPNLVIGFRAVTYDFGPGFRVGFGYEGNWDTKLYFTKFNTRGIDSANGNLTTGFLGGRLSQTIPDTTFYQSGQADFRINFNTLDWNIGKHFDVTDSLMLRPLIGLEGGIINQTLNTSFQGQPLSISESVKNNFRGIGPKVGIESNLVFWRANEFRYSLVADVETSYLWGRWHITDLEQTSTSGSVMVNVADRNFGALGIQGMMGINLNYKNFSMKLGYEISDWLNQCQIFDDETGTQNNDLVLQGLTLNLSYKF
ncbi:MAG: Lpg1974 family pore-forming outer membrane protein [Gammaproteobacteria bacterium]|nr:Lpg1974 family pore-forming outer membrane protein [Gammaproteobacteria bacterium]